METELQRQNQAWKEARARIAAAAVKTKQEPPVTAPPEPPAPTAQVIKLIPLTHNVSGETMDMVVAAVGVALDLPVNEIIAGPPLPEYVSARKLAMALCARLLRISASRVAEHFEVCDQAVVDAIDILDPILTHYAISGKSPLHLCMPLIVKAWNGRMEEARRIPTIREIQLAVCQVWRISHLELISDCRATSVVLPRQVAMALAKRLTPKSFPEIGRRSGGRDHTTVFHANRKMAPVIEAVAQKMSPLAGPLQWASAVYQQLTITPTAKGKRG